MSAARNGIAGALLLVLGGCASHPGQGSSVEASFIRATETWDLNHDGIVTCQEWRSYAEQLFKAADKANKGALSRDEFQRIAQQDRLFDTANFEYYDTDKNGVVTKAEFVDRPNPAFATLDKTKSCQLTAQQYRVPEEKNGAPVLPESVRDAQSSARR